MREISEVQLATAIEIRPEVTVLSVLRHLNYKAWFAIAEFIDNALQSYLTNRAALEAIHGRNFRLTVDVRIETVGHGLIVVTDNAAGISAADFPRAFRAAQVPSDRNGLSEFGMGMKSAACWFAEKWSVRTKAINENFERTIHFDVRHIVDNKIESLATEFRDVGGSSIHYTVVSLHGLHHVPQGRTLAKIKAHLASIYRIFLRDRCMVLRVNGEELCYSSPGILSAMKYASPGTAGQGEEAQLFEWKKDISLDFGEGMRVTGFAALRETGSTTLAGFALFRRNRLIEGSHDETYRPDYIFGQTNSYRYQRLFGELHIEGFDVSHTKDGFRWEDYEDIFLEFLKKELQAEPLDLLTQADNYRALPSKKSIQERAVVATAAVADYVEKDVAPLLIESQAAAPIVPSLPEALATTELQSSEKTVSISDGVWNWNITLRTSVDPAREDWVSMAMQSSLSSDLSNTRRLVVELSLVHPFSSEFIGVNNQNIELFLRIATAFCISLVLLEDHTGQAPQDALYHFNYLMRGALINAALNENDSRN